MNINRMYMCIYMNVYNHFLLSLTPTTIVLHLLMTNILLLAQVEHYNLKAIFLVVLAFFLNIGLVYPPNPLCLASYLRLP